MDGYKSQTSASEVYQGQYASRVQAAQRIEALLTDLMDQASINYLSVVGRAKEPASFAKKASKKNADGSDKYSDPLSQIKDQIAVRIITFLPEAVLAGCQIVRANFEVVEEVDKGVETARRGTFGYASNHFVVRLDSDRQGMPEYSSVGATEFEIQVRTTLQHAWAEFEHDVRYKVNVPSDHRPEFDRRFALAAGLIELADNEFTAINALFQELLQAQQSAADLVDPINSVDALANWLAARYPSAPRSKAAHYAWLSQLLSELRLDDIEALGKALRDVDSDDVCARMGHPYPPGSVRRLDDDLLEALGDAYMDVPTNRKRRSILLKRAMRLRGQPREQGQGD